MYYLLQIWAGYDLRVASKEKSNTSKRSNFNYHLKSDALDWLQQFTRFILSDTADPAPSKPVEYSLIKKFLFK